ncbi:hypothetical protein [Microbulbifer celer]|uniref:Uncharacterized protein n=1 Tax=Microbulbifer celer TaxID=435905 RepID=A0ABW3UBX5_9GAMM|nr:hypothetical protein [Microbulbifer celer]UFN58115.1 hypothetical protein LPW13_03435 [Microbulbifer celer]
MGSKLPQDQLELYKRIDEILFYKWDPIGISNGDWARDEYQSYLPRVFKMAIENGSAKEIANYLTKISTEYMGLSEAKEHDLAVAKLILEVKNSVGLS